MLDSVLRILLPLLVLALVAAACSPTEEPAATDAEATEAAPDGSVGVDSDGNAFPAPPEVPDGALAATAAQALDTIFDTPLILDLDAVASLADSGDPRVLWAISDLMRFVQSRDEQAVLRDTAEALAGIDLGDRDFPWGLLTDHLIAWDLPDYDGYVDHKAALFTSVEPGWAPFFDDPDATIDWRQVSWGGVFIDDRPLGDTQPCEGGCIPSLDDPPFVPAEEGAYYPDDRIVFGVVIGEDVVALPRNIMEVHEMVNATIGGRRVAIPYCTLCGAAQVFFTDTEGGGTDEIVMRTSGLLRRSNKVMYDLTTESVFDTFTGHAVTGPLREMGVVLQQAPVVTSTWGDWKDDHPDTMILQGNGGIGRTYPLDPLRGRDDNGPIFPVGVVDERLGVHDQVLGVVLDDGSAVAFAVLSALERLEDGEEVVFDGIRVQRDAGGLTAELDGQQLPTHQAFWFAWSQFHPETALWPHDVQD